VLDSGISTQASLYRWARYGLYALAVWAVVLGLLFLLGLVLSRLTLRAVNRREGLVTAEISAGERLLRQIYRVVIGITAAYFYLSIPVLLLSVIAPIVIFGYIFFTFGSIPIRLAIFVLVIAVYTLIALVRSFFVRLDQKDPGRDVTKAEALYLWRELEEVARQVGTRPVDRVFAAPGTGIGVFERGGLWKRISGRGERCLLLGLGALPGMTQGQFRAILAHEYGHFTNQDTAGGDMANRVRFILQNMVRGLASVGTATWYNPAWWFVSGFFKIFLRVTQGASRLQEFLADRYAAAKYGVENFRHGLEHVIRQSFLFNQQLGIEVNQAVSEKRGLHNLYTLPEGEDLAKVDEAFAKALDERTSAYDSHPSYRERMAFIERLPAARWDQTDNRPVWDLISAAPVLQEEMTRVVEANLRAQNVPIGAAEASGA